MLAPEGSIVNHEYPYSGGNRALVGHYMPGLVLAALAPALKDRVIAGVGCPIWSILLRGRDGANRPFTLKAFFNGGMGASAHRDGPSATSWPSNISGTPVEVIEQGSPVRVLKRSLRAGSGGGGAHRGGDGIEQHMMLLEGGPYTIGINAERTRSPARGLFGGASGACGEVVIAGRPVDIKDGPFALSPGDVLEIRTPGGGGFGAASM